MFFIFVPFFFLFKIIYNRKAYFLNYNLQTNEKKKEILYHPIYPSLRLLKTNPFCLFPRLNPTTLLPLTQRLNQTKCQKVWVFKTFSTCCHLLLYMACYFLLLNEIFSSMFLTFSN